MKGRWLITGASGQLGSAVADIATALDHDIFCPTRHEMDLTDPAAIKTIFGSERFQGVFNCAAYTAVDKAESQPDLAFVVNATAPKILAEECAKRGLPLIHVSTDYVFDGNKPAPYVEDDPVSPIGVYGLSKEMGESAVRNSGAQHAIIRTAWLLNPSGTNFLTTMLRLGLERDELRIVSDQLGCPTSVKDLATALILIAGQLDNKCGTWNFVNQGAATWFELATYIFEKAKEHGCRVPMLTPITTSEYPTPARRPANSRLSIAKLEKDFGIRPRRWQYAVDSILAERFI